MPENRIEDISHLDGLVNLTSLDVKWNNVTDLSPLSNLVNMVRIRFYGNPVADVTPLYSLQKLTVLDLQDVILDAAAIIGTKSGTLKL